MNTGNCALIPPPTEEEEQQCLFRWVEWQQSKYPELGMLYHIPNGGKRNKSEAGRFKAAGVKSGVPDLCLPVARGNYHGLYIELKRIKHGKTSERQEKWLDELKKQGYFTAVCNGWEKAARVLIEYLRMGK